MPKDLAALLVSEGAAPADAVARALERQREAGGAIDTALLELGAIAEEALVPYLARAAGLPPAPAQAWAGDDARARRVFPSRVAERHGLAPFALDGRELALVGTYPVDVALLDEISFMLSLHLTAHVGPEWRVRELIHRLYGTPFPPRLAALAARSGMAVDAGAAPPEEQAPPPPPATGFGSDDSEPAEPLAAALAQALETFDWPAEDGAAPEQPADAGPEEPPPPRAAADRTAPPRWKLADARAALAAAADRDAIVLAALRYARDFFEFAAMFAATRDAVAGHDALGPDDARERARSVAIWASDPGIFKTVIETRSPYLGPVSRGASGTEAILDGLARGAPRTVLVYPVILRDRAVCALYADNGEAPVSARRLGDLLLLLSTVGAAFERVIRGRKSRPRRQAAAAPGASGSPPPAATPERVASPPPSGGEPSPAEPSAAPAPASVFEAAIASIGGVGDGAAPGAGAPPQPAPSSSTDGWGDAPARSLDDIEVEFTSAPEPPQQAPRPASPLAAASDAAPPRAPKGAASAPVPPPPAPAAPAAAGPAALADRALDPDADVAAAACDALAVIRRDPKLRPVQEKLRRALLSGMALRATRAARALEALRDVESIPLLIQVLETSEPEPARASADALSRITLQRLGTDARKWLAWWKKNRGRGRADWLFSGLTSPDREARLTAAAELREAADAPVEYSPDMPPAERERCARAWASWWSRSGRVL